MPKINDDELRNLVQHYPVWPGDTISHRTMNDLGKLGLAVRQADGSWIPTAAGIAEFERRWAGEKK